LLLYAHCKRPCGPYVANKCMYVCKSSQPPRETCKIQCHLSPDILLQNKRRKNTGSRPTNPGSPRLQALKCIWCWRCGRCEPGLVTGWTQWLPAAVMILLSDSIAGNLLRSWYIFCGKLFNFDNHVHKGRTLLYCRNWEIALSWAWSSRPNGFPSNVYKLCLLLRDVILVLLVCKCLYLAGHFTRDKKVAWRGCS